MMDPKKAVWKESERHYRDLFWREERGELTGEESARLNDITKRLGMSKLDFLWGMWHIAYNTLQHRDREADMGKDPNADTGPKEPVDQDSNPDGPAGQDMSPEISDQPVLENMNEDAALLAQWELIMRSDVEIMGLLQDRDAHYAKHEDCALKETCYRKNPAVDNLVNRAWTGKLTFGEIKKLQNAAAGDGQQLSPDERQAFEKHAEDRGQTLEEFLQILLEINRFVGKTGEDDFNYEDNHEGMIDHCARTPLFLPAAFANIDVMRTLNRRKMLAAIIVLQADEMKEQAKGRGTWSLKTTVSVAKALIINYSSLLKNGAAVGADEPPHGGPTVYGLAYLSMFKDAHEAASGLLKNALCASYVEKAKVDAICGWLRDTKVSFPPQLPWDAPKNIHEGLALLMDKFDLSGKPPAAAPDTSKKTSRAPKKHMAVTIKDAAQICDKSPSTIKKWERNVHTPEGWPGRGDLMVLKAFANTREGKKKLKKAIKNAARIGDMDKMSRHVAR